MLTNGGSTALEPPYDVFISSSQYTGQQSAWNWGSTYGGGGTLGGPLPAVRQTPFRGIPRDTFIATLQPSSNL